ncbi:MAG: hypothetical protein FWE43_02925 [Streptococcaceae bacterium]|nr:hypothetical protein [Streptococcaceae bacterium]MCL2681416.1 hypothetical protein [Streptococcaceae bacterium]
MKTYAQQKNHLKEELSNYLFSNPEEMCYGRLFWIHDNWSEFANDLKNDFRQKDWGFYDRETLKDAVVDLRADFMPAFEILKDYYRENVEVEYDASES